MHALALMVFFAAASSGTALMLSHEAGERFKAKQVKDGWIILAFSACGAITSNVAVVVFMAEFPWGLLH